MWVIDGYADGVYYIEYYNYNTGESARKEKTLPLVHCNWGWGGQGNGYYLFNVFDMQYSDPHKTRATYNSNISAYVNISPKINRYYAKSDCHSLHNIYSFFQSFSKRYSKTNLKIDIPSENIHFRMQVYKGKTILFYRK